MTVVGDVNANAVAEQALFLMLACARQGVALDRAVREGDFAARSRLQGVELCGRTLLVVGFGRIGQLVATRAQAFGMEIVVVDAFADPGRFPGVRFAPSLDEGLAMADVVTLHVPLTAQTRDLLDAAALLAALDSGHVRAAGLDTFEVEPLPAGNPLARHPMTVLSPHSAALTEEALIGMGVMTVRNALAALDGCLDPALVVNRAVLEKTDA